MEASDLVHEVSEAAERRQDADDEVPDRVTGSIEEVEEMTKPTVSRPWAARRRHRDEWRGGSREREFCRLGGCA